MDRKSPDISSLLNRASVFRSAWLSHCKDDFVALLMDWAEALPALEFPAGWQVTIVPPFMGALVRFYVRRADTPKDGRVSVYFDAYGILGFMPQPYWELYPDRNGDNARFFMRDTDELMVEITGGLDRLATHSN